MDHEHQHDNRTLLVQANPHRAMPDQIRLREFQELARSAGAEVCETCTVTCRQPNPGLYLGTGKVQEIAELVAALNIKLAIFNNSLTPIQERNLERALSCRVLDRTGLILDIFAQRARSHEGKLQVELAQSEHLATRLVRGWTHLERQKGGIGLRGPGETQLETDRRLLGQRINQIRKRLLRVENQRSQGRRARQRAALPTIALVGYTNVGKSTLFNQLTQARVAARDQLFATLDPTLRRACLPNGQPFILADTVGFISELPHGLVAAFKSTLQEVAEADILLHVVDAASPNRAEQMADVDQVLDEIGAASLPKLIVYNKIDQMMLPMTKITKDEENTISAVWLSAQQKQGLDLLQQALQERLSQQWVNSTLQLDMRQGRLRAQLYQSGSVLSETITEAGGWKLQVRLSPADYARLQKDPAIRI
ncbi:MAG: ribosome rescue GTPase HflX [Pseudomonadota bacterium]